MATHKAVLRDGEKLVAVTRVPETIKYGEKIYRHSQFVKGVNSSFTEYQLDLSSKITR